MKRLTKSQLLKLLKQKQGERHQREFAAELGVSQQYLSDVLADRREPGEGILQPLGLKRVIYYEERL